MESTTSPKPEVTVANIKEEDISSQNAPPVESPTTPPELKKQPSWENPETFKGASFRSTIVNIINTVIGAGILSIAYSIMLAGVAGSIILIILVLIPSLITSYYLSCATVYTNESVYGVVGTKLSNKIVGALADFSNCLLYFGVDIAYMNVLFQQVVDIGAEVFRQEKFFTDYRTLISFIITLVILFPLSSSKNMDALAFTSSIAVICIAIFVIACIYLGIVGIMERGWDLEWWPTSPSGLSTAFAVFVLCFCSHVNSSKIVSELKYTSKSKFKTKVNKSMRATIIAYVVCALSYFFVGICGYMAFGNAIAESVLDSLKSKDLWFKPIIRIGYGLVVMFSYPILGFPAVNTIDAYIFNTERTVARRYIEGFIWCLVTWILAVMIPSLSVIFGITGCFCGSLIVFIWPSLYFIFMYRKERAKPVEMRSSWFKPKTYEYVVAWIILVVGAIVCLYTTQLEIAKLFKSS